MILIQMAIDSVFGFIAHLIRDTATGHMSRSWQDISHYAIGVISILPLSFLLFVYLEQDIKSCRLRYIVTYTLSFVPFGIGVVLGHWYKPVKE